jgi:hypothetical protein
MLIEFKFKNFRSFRDETTISFVGSSDKSLENNFTTIPSFNNRKILNSTVIYGPNASGKTSFIKAIQFVDNFVNNSSENKPGAEIDFQQFLFSNEEQSEPTEFEISFIDNKDNRYQYGFQLNREYIVREWLVAYPKGLPQTWFERTNSSKKSQSDYYFGRKLKGKNKQVAELTRSNVLFLTNAAKFNHKQLTQVFTWFQDSLRVIDFDSLRLFLNDYTQIKASESKELQRMINNLLVIADFGISGLDIQEETYTDKDFPEDFPAEIKKEFINQKHFEVYMLHEIVEGIKVPLPLKEESSGTQRFFALSSPLLEVLINGWTLFIDELDSSLHPLLVKFIVDLFHNPSINKNGAQLIFNTHDTTLMDCCIFRRDQIWFIEKDRQGCSHLYPLLEYSPRKEEALAKGYLMGRYGAIPFLGEPNWSK